MVDGVLVTLELFIGAAIGTAIVNTVATVPAPAVPPDLSPVWTWVFVILLVAGLAVVFQVRPKDFGWVVGAGVLAFAGTVIGAQFGSWQGSFVGALVLVLHANLSAWRLRRPTPIVMPTAVMMLVPGAAAYRGLQAVETSGVVAGLTAGWHVHVNILAIMAGLLAAYSLVTPRATL